MTADGKCKITVARWIGKLFVTRDILTRKLILEAYIIPNINAISLLKNCKVPVDYLLSFVGGEWNFSSNNMDLLPVENLD